MEQYLHEDVQESSRVRGRHVSKTTPGGEGLLGRRPGALFCHLFF